VNKCSYQGKRILDLGAGSGEVWRNITWPYELFVAADASEDMLRLHPKVDKKILCNFDEASCFQRLSQFRFDQVFASSSLQWSKDLKRVFERIAALTPNVALALFSANTFKTIHQLSKLRSPIYEKEEIVERLNEYFSVKIEIKEYKLFFKDKLELFRYIKRSGVSQGVKRLSYKETKRLIESYPYNYLEFEVVFAWSKE
jgi:malonyl-CoA O-methyltransferase